MIYRADKGQPHLPAVGVAAQRQIGAESRKFLPVGDMGEKNGVVFLVQREFVGQIVGR